MDVTDSEVSALSDAAAQMNTAGSQGTPRFDPEVAHPARVYGYWLGCKDHYRADREAAEEVIRQRPQVVAGARANRAFLARAVRYLAAQRGVRQFLDIGAGLPAPGNTPEVAQAVAPDSRVVYVDNDPVVLSHARALLASTPEGSCDCINADLRTPDAILREAGRILDFTRPVAILLVAVLASSRSMLLVWVRNRANLQVAGVPATAVTCGSPRMSGSRTRRPGRCVFLRRVSPGRRKTFSI
jgi:S-adenosyl methyltransferase